MIELENPHLATIIVKINSATTHQRLLKFVGKSLMRSRGLTLSWGISTQNTC